MLGIWGVQNVGCETFKMWDVGNVGFLGKNVAVCWHQIIKEIVSKQKFFNSGTYSCYFTE